MFLQIGVAFILNQGDYAEQADRGSVQQQENMKLVEGLCSKKYNV